MHVDVLILGGGVAGLATARSLDVDTCVLEKEETLGGCLRSDTVAGYTIDRTGHLLHFRDPYVRRLMFEELDIDWLDFERNAKVHIFGRDVPYPIQYNLHALPEHVRQDCLRSYLENAQQEPSVDGAFENWARGAFGSGLFDCFFGPYNRKLWQVDLRSMSADWAERFIPLPDKDLILQGAASAHRNAEFGYNAHFSYPREGASQAIIEALARTVAHPIRTGAEVVAVDIDARRSELADGSQISYKKLVNTLPLPRFIGLIDNVDPHIAQQSEGLRHNSILYFAFGFKTGGQAPDTHWLYVPEERFVIYRAGVLSNYSSSVAPEGSVLICAEIAFPGKEAREAKPDEMASQALNDLVELGLVDETWVLEMTHHGVIDCAYVVFDDHRKNALPRIQAYLREHGIHSIGRYGAWDYGSMGDAILAGRDCAEELTRIWLD